MTELFTVGIPQPESPARAQYLRRARELAAAAASGRAAVPDLIDIDLGAVYIRLGQVGEAIDVLTRASAKDRRNPLVFANLGTAHQLEGRWARAIDALQQAKENWPQELARIDAGAAEMVPASRRLPFETSPAPCPRITWPPCRSH